jgi:hypothetical protein
LLTLYGCATPEEIAARQAYEEEQRRYQQAAYAERLKRQCRAIGYQENTDSFRNCVLQLHSQTRGLILQQILQEEAVAGKLAS